MTKKRRPRVSQTARISSLEWNIRDAKEALENAARMGSWDGVIKYAQQLKALETKLYRSSVLGTRRRYDPREWMSGQRARETTAQWQNRIENQLRGRSGIPR